jgi:hypothetical protein
LSSRVIIAFSEELSSLAEKSVVKKTKKLIEVWCPRKTPIKIKRNQLV